MTDLHFQSSLAVPGIPSRHAARSAGGRGVAAPALGWAPAVLRHLGRPLVWAWNRRTNSAAAKRLYHFPDYLLADIGLTRDQIGAAVAGDRSPVMRLHIR